MISPEYSMLSEEQYVRTVHTPEYAPAYYIQEPAPDPVVTPAPADPVLTMNATSETGCESMECMTEMLLKDIGADGAIEFQTASNASMQAAAPASEPAKSGGIPWWFLALGAYAGIKLLAGSGSGSKKSSTLSGVRKPKVTSAGTKKKRTRTIVL